MTDLKFKDWFMGTCPHMEGPHVTLYIGPHNGGYTTTLTHCLLYFSLMSTYWNLNLKKINKRHPHKQNNLSLKLASVF